jgi:hypothetical protein
MKNRHGLAAVLTSAMTIAAACVGLGGQAATAVTPAAMAPVPATTAWGPGDYTLEFGRNSARRNSAHCAAEFTLYEPTDQPGRTSTVAAVIETAAGVSFELRVGLGSGLTYLRASGGSPGFANGTTQIAGNMTGRVDITDQMPQAVSAGLAGVSLASIGGCPLQASTAPVAPATPRKPERVTREVQAPRLSDPANLIVTAIRAGNDCWPTISGVTGLGRVALCGGARATQAWTVDAFDGATPAIWYAQDLTRIATPSCSFVFGGQRHGETWIMTMSATTSVNPDVVAKIERATVSTFFLQPTTPC